MAIDPDVNEMWRHLERICSWNRLSGGPGEARAVDYVVEVLRGYGVPVQVHSFDAYLSNPLSGELEVAGRKYRAKTRAFSASTDGVTGELVHVPGGSDMFKDTETAGRIAATDLRGKVVLTESGSRSNMIAAYRGGAVGFVHMWPSDEPYVHEGTVSPVWGTPTPETIDLIPRIPVVQITQADGERLRAEGGTATLRTRTQTGWFPVRLPVADIRGASDEFVLVAGHIDSWHLGVTDNGTGNVACLEIARLMKHLQPQLRRGVRVAWWPCHSNGRYAGSTWYADHAWQDIHDHCVGYINIDSPGAAGATVYDLITATAENAAFLKGIVREIAGQDPAWERPLRAGDQSFWGPGVSSAHMLLSSRPVGQRAAVGGCGLGWWWHTEEDTMDKADREVLATDCRILAETCYRLATDEVLPYDLTAAIDELAAEVRRLQDAAKGHADFSDLLGALAALRNRALPTAPAARNRAVLRALRALTPINYTAAGPFDHDAAVPAKPVPALQGAARLPTLDPAGSDYRFLQTRLQREQNRLVAAVRQAGW